MKSARVTIHLASERVQCDYVFHNTGPAREVVMGFPEGAGGDVSLPEPGKAEFLEFRSYVDGNPVQVEPLPAVQTNGWKRFWVKKVRFEAGQTRTVRNIYVGGGGGSVTGRRLFGYVLSAGASWKGSIGLLTVTVDLTGLGRVSWERIEPPGYTRSENRITWRWANVEPTRDVFMTYFPGYDDIWVDGEKWSPGMSWGPAPQLEAGEVVTSLRQIGHWLGEEAPRLSWDPKTKSASVEIAGKRVVTTAGSEAAMVDGREIPLGRKAALAGHQGSVLVAPLGPIAKAVGAAVRFDPVTERTYLHTAEARAKKPAPQWPSRKLTEAELRGKSPSELRIMRNTIYAVRGREFENRWLRHYFFCQPWYQPSPNYSGALLSALDQANIATIQRVEAQKRPASNP